MVFGRLLQSIGLCKAQATVEAEPLSTTTTTSAVSAEDSICSSSETSSPSAEPKSLVQRDEVFAKKSLLQFRHVAHDAVSETLPSSSPMKSAYRFEVERIGSPKSAPSDKRLDVLAPTAGSWTAAMRSKRGEADSSADDEKVNRKACSILNKLTVEKFDSLFEQLATCGIQKPEHLEMLMSEVFNKATTQHHFIAMYADLCVRLDQDSRISSVVDGEGHSFRRLLLNQCQMSFEKLLQPGEVTSDSKGMDTDEEYSLKRKQQALGNIKLIAQLLVHGIVQSKLLVECSEELLRCRDTCPEALESLAALLTVAGKQFDTKNWQYHPRLLEVIESMRKLSKDKTTQSRVRFLLRDVLDVRDAGWSHCTYKATLATAPMKLAEVAESANNEGKYMSLDDQIETDNLLSGLMCISQKANERQSASYLAAQPKPWQKGKKHNFHVDKQAAAAADLKVKKDTLRAKSKESSPAAEYDLVAFRRALASVLLDLSTDKNVPAAVRRIRLQAVPPEFQAKEFVDIITRIVEERRGPIRRCALAFTAGLAAADEESAFDRTACLDGIRQFFHEVYPQLCNEIPRLPAIATSELLPTLRTVFPGPELNNHLPAALAEA